MVAWWVVGALFLASIAISILLRPKVKAPRPDEAKDLEDPTADAGRPIPVVFGTITVKGLNVLWFGDKSQRKKKISA